MWTILESSADKASQLPELDEPLVLGEEVRAPADWPRLLAYVGGSVILLACLAAQLLYFYPDYFLRHTFWRPLVADACALANCELRTEKNAAAMRSVFLTVEPHPEYQQMLLVQFRAQNSANYEMELPAVELLFTNQSRDPVAGRRFYPASYLPPGTTDSNIIAAGAEISGQLAISDPGEDAVNYALEFVYDN